MKIRLSLEVKDPVASLNLNTTISRNSTQNNKNKRQIELTTDSKERSGPLGSLVSLLSKENPYIDREVSSLEENDALSGA